jgi:mycothiol system anti-sigma-R factor
MTEGHGVTDGRTDIPDCGADCQETLAEIEAFLDGEVDVTIQSRVEVHLSDCSPCMQRVEFRRHVKLLVSRKCGHETLPPGLRERISALIDGDADSR